MEYTQQLGPAYEVGVRDVLAIVWRRKWVIAITMALCLGGAYIITKRMTRLYRATATLIVQGPMPGNVVTPGTAAALPIVETAQTQLTMLRTEEMRFKVAAWLDKQRRDIENGQSKLVQAQARASRAVWENLEAQRQQGQTQLDGLKQLLGDRTLWAQYPNVVTMSNPDDTNLISISVVLPEARETSRFANAIGQAFVDWKTEAARANVDEVAKSLESRADGAKEAMENAEKAVTDYKLRTDTPDVPAQQRNLLEQYFARQAEVGPMQADVAAQDATVQDLQQRLAKARAELKAGPARDDSEVVRLQQAVQERQQELDTALRTYTPAYPRIPILKGELQDLQNQLAQAKARSLKNLDASPSNMSALNSQLGQAQGLLDASRVKLRHAVAARDALRARLRTIPTAALEYFRLQNEADMATQINQQFQTALANAKLNTQTTVGNVQLFARAVTPDSPFEPDPLKNMLLGGLMGLALSVGVALMLEQSDRRVRAVRDARRIVSSPIVGALPSLSRNQITQMVRGELPPVAMEAYGMVRANLGMALRKDGHADPWHRQIILVTSAVPGEGKSISAAQIARSLARSGKTVILVDADMRRPAQNRLFNTAEPVGLADVLTNGLPLEEALVASDTENLSILHSGMPVRNPTELVSLPQMVETLETLRNEADVVLVDAPACAAMADALLIAPHVDCIFYVIGAGLVDELTVMHTIAALNAAAPKTMVCFVNRAGRPSGRRAYRSYYSYQYSYADAGSRGNGGPPLPLPAAEEAGGTKGASSSPRENAN